MTSTTTEKTDKKTDTIADLAAFLTKIGAKSLADKAAKVAELFSYDDILTLVMDEGVELSELSKETLKSYVNKAKDRGHSDYKALKASGRSIFQRTSSENRKSNNKSVGVNRAEKKITKESVDEAVQEIIEKLGPDATVNDYVHDFVHSKNSRFAGKSKKDRIRQAVAAFNSRKSIGESVEEGKTFKANDSDDNTKEKVKFQVNKIKRAKEKRKFDEAMASEAISYELIDGKLRIRRARKRRVNRTKTLGEDANKSMQRLRRELNPYMHTKVRKSLLKGAKD